MVTDKDYKRVADRVYDVDPNKVQNPVKDGQKILNNQYQVLKTENNTSNGMQAMAVAPVDKKGNVDTSQVVIAYAGTNRSDPDDIATDVQSIGHGRDELKKRGSSPTGPTVDSQFKTAKAFAKKIEKAYPKAKLTTTGHSLGGSLSMYVALKRKYHSTTYNGPDIHSMLSSKEIAYMKKHKRQFRNYRNPNDMIGNITGNETGSAIYVDMANKSGLSADHSLSNWKFDKKGNLVDKANNMADLGHVYDTVEGKVSAYMNHSFKAMKSKLGAGGYSGHEKIYLDYLSASTVAKGLGSTAQIGYDSIKGQVRAANEAADELYKSLTSKRPASVNKLTDEEILAIYAEEGLTYDYMVTQVKEHFDQKTAKASALSDNFTALSSHIERGMQDLVAKDNTLGGEISGWTHGM
ncbi:lipase family protein [Streptococcus macacae]|uniref:Triacylglycerol lipase domain protein n=1 Tax=Streptococcus macacae NCTC 11558 TaxID=764298 RepID=G5JVQ9_9STRE|nr:DUF2974 domain-containing protein [Streptococcus macacae]EHJ52968.1 triacylglycerol lipase domain protein [Streptococcus macacae NCTC 11558]SUN78725.1 Predicted lipase [Streptococcus macacae NCTC 11558]